MEEGGNRRSLTSQGNATRIVRNRARILTEKGFLMTKRRHQPWPDRPEHLRHTGLPYIASSKAAAISGTRQVMFYVNVVLYPAHGTQRRPAARCSLRMRYWRPGHELAMSVFLSEGITRISLRHRRATSSLICAFPAGIKRKQA